MRIRRPDRLDVNPILELQGLDKRGGYVNVRSAVVTSMFVAVESAATSKLFLPVVTVSAVVPTTVSRHCLPESVTDQPKWP